MNSAQPDASAKSALLPVPIAQGARSIAVANNYVIGTTTGIGQEDGPQVTISDNATDFAVLKSTNILNKEQYVDIFLTPRSTEQERKAALNLNLGVLSRRGSIQDVGRLFNSLPPQSRD
jgi:hypothetical protein